MRTRDWRVVARLLPGCCCGPSAHSPPPASAPPWMCYYGDTFPTWYKMPLLIREALALASGSIPGSACGIRLLWLVAQQQATMPFSSSPEWSVDRRRENAHGVHAPGAGTLAWAWRGTWCRDHVHRSHSHVGSGGCSRAGPCRLDAGLLQSLSTLSDSTPTEGFQEHGEAGRVTHGRDRRGCSLHMSARSDFTGTWHKNGDVGYGCSWVQHPGVCRGAVLLRPGATSGWQQRQPQAGALDVQLRLERQAQSWHDSPLWQVWAWCWVRRAWKQEGLGALWASGHSQLRNKRGRDQRRSQL